MLSSEQTVVTGTALKAGSVRLAVARALPGLAAQITLRAVVRHDRARLALQAEVVIPIPWVLVNIVDDILPLRRARIDRVRLDIHHPPPVLLLLDLLLRALLDLVRLDRHRRGPLVDGSLAAGPTERGVALAHDVVVRFVLVAAATHVQL